MKQPHWRRNKPHKIACSHPRIAEREREAARDVFRNRDWADGLSDPELDVVLATANNDQSTEAQQRVMRAILAKIAATHARRRTD